MTSCLIYETSGYYKETEPPAFRAEHKLEMEGPAAQLLSIVSGALLAFRIPTLQGSRTKDPPLSQNQVYLGRCLKPFWIINLVAVHFG